MELDFDSKNVLAAVVLTVALGVSGWALVREIDIDARVHVMEATSVQERTDNDRRFGELSDRMKSVSDKLDKLLERVGK